MTNPYLPSGCTDADIDALVGEPDFSAYGMNYEDLVSPCCSCGEDVISEMTATKTPLGWCHNTCLRGENKDAIGMVLGAAIVVAALVVLS